MIINGKSLEPITPFVSEKTVTNGASYGLSHAGYDVRIAQDVTLYPCKNFALASTFEHFHMPKNMMAIVHDKSTWARPVRFQHRHRARLAGLFDAWLSITAGRRCASKRKLASPKSSFMSFQTRRATAMENIKTNQTGHFRDKLKSI